MRRRVTRARSAGHRMKAVSGAPEYERHDAQWQ
jgi:hypothetical protein